MGVYAKAGSARARSLRATLGGVAILGASALVLAGCAGGGGGDTTSSGSLALKIGTILPQTGTLAVLGPPEIAGVDQAKEDINAANAGITLDVEQKDSGDTTTDIATQSATSLIADGVSAIVGAASSGVSKTFIDQVTQAGVVQISPANTSPDFTNYDDDGYYWRTAPSDVLQGRILGNKILGDGKTNVSILYMNDAYGTGLEKNIKETLVAGGASVVAEEIFEPASTDFNSALTSVLAPNPDALVVISFDEIKTIAEQLAAKGFDFSKLYGTDGNYGVISESDTNVDIAGAQFTNPGVQASTDFQSKLQALVKSQGNPPLTVFSYAPESYDATVLVALAALQGKGTEGSVIRDNLMSVSEGGTKCTTFADCASKIKNGEDIDYDGLSGPISFDKNGDPSEASVSIYKYSAGNVTSFEETVDGSLN
ncbi:MULTISPECIES: ABC transporter substrate-binding protein [unclassified Rathayibacter]|uniref:ABC transporter substrate-binding protein n=1 Tax=unclassified Rathayibacter TaxID=2609250 RepID=UPI00188A2553|nr:MULTISPECIES: ABC transporter substrate-binding protein [unclassified Rathayibacter]MBF4461644.1 ABC transporter substrate-binding protein [Rathayibacter sp. VKM Ac-2879]MBF4503055.1 ABC transporter substrate-binding protein [Rathayibacter sp. VKM Ac-2878]